MHDHTVYPGCTISKGNYDSNKCCYLLGSVCFPGVSAHFQISRLAFCLHFPQCSLIVTSDVSNLSTNRLRSTQKYQTPVVGLDYVYSCVDRGVLLPVDEYKLDASSPSAVIPKSTVVMFSLFFFITHDVLTSQIPTLGHLCQVHMK